MCITCIFCITCLFVCIRPRAGFRGEGRGPGPQASHQQGASHQTPQLKLNPALIRPNDLFNVICLCDCQLHLLAYFKTFLANVSTCSSTSREISSVCFCPTVLYGSVRGGFCPGIFCPGFARPLHSVRTSPACSTSLPWAIFVKFLHNVQMFTASYQTGYPPYPFP